MPIPVDRSDEPLDKKLPTVRETEAKAFMYEEAGRFFIALTALVQVAREMLVAQRDIEEERGRNQPRR